jgi:dTDP-glucose 4,6-dehydratase
VEWLFAVLAHGVARRAYNVGSDCAISIKDLAFAVREALGSSSEIRIIGADVLGASNVYIPNVDRIKRELDVDMKIDLRDSILKTVEGQ